VREALDGLEAEGFPVDAMRLKAFPFGPEVPSLCAAHDNVVVLEQNRDAQMRTLLMTEAGIAGDKLVPLLSYDGMPTTAAVVRDGVMRALAKAT
jgi:2-oxoglutarate ferredoxin oxidoreductase subunit alpha